MNLCDIKTIREIMKNFGLSFRKEFGQNFLTNITVVERIAEYCCEGKSRNILEIGPGIGTLTDHLAERYDSVVAVEIDRGLIPVLEYTLEGRNNVRIVNEDIMKCNIAELTEPYLSGGLSVCANLPYYITTPILMTLLESKIAFDYITIMIQAEVATRLVAKPGTADYGAITAVLNYYGSVERLFTVPAGVFLPPPKVNSAVIRIKLYKEKPVVPVSEEILFRTIKSAFGQRRKTLPNSLAAGFPEFEKEVLVSAVTECGFPADIRGERLGIADFARLSDVIASRLNRTN
jgi:16S rRNA (adenine1518-N6/adenine1519-N6)-dimethyltransferase